MRKLPRAVFPERSVALQKTVLVLPTTKCEPDGGLQRTATGPSIASVAEALIVTTWVFDPNGATQVKPAGRLRTGAIRSTIVMVKLFETELPPESVTEQVTVVGPRGKSEPGRGEQSGLNLPSIRSVADAAYLTARPLGTAYGSVMSDGTITVGLPSKTEAWNAR